MNNNLKAFGSSPDIPDNIDLWLKTASQVGNLRYVQYASVTYYNIESCL